MASGALIQSLSRARLIDEYQLTITPLVLGEGRRLRGVRANRAVHYWGDRLAYGPRRNLATGTAPP